MIEGSSSTGPPVRWAILGTGGVSRKFVLGLRTLGDSAVTTVVASREASNAVRFAKDFRCHRAAGSYAEAAGAPDVDAVYVATPPSHHETHALLAIAAGKSVLIEKPFALDADAAQRIATAASEAGVFCMEAMWTRFMPLFAVIRQHLSDGTIGELRSFEGSFLGSDVFDSTASLFDHERGGGALMHRGVYPLSIARFLVGPIDEVRSLARLGSGGVDDECLLLLRHRSGALSSIRASLSSNGSNGFTLHGSHGVIEVKGPVYRPTIARLTRSSPNLVRGSSGTRSLEKLRERGTAQALRQRCEPLLTRLRRSSLRISEPYDGNGYHYEAAEVGKARSRGLLESPVMPLSESIEIMRIIDSARSHWSKQPPQEI